MTEFVVSAKLIADASRMKAGVSEGKASLDSLSRATIEGADAAQRMTAAEYRAVQGIQALARASTETTGTIRRNTQAVNDNVAAARRHQQALRGVGIQLGDVAQGLAMGANPAIVFGQQIGQVALAAEGFQGKLGALARFMSTPWGAAIQFGVIMLGSLGASFLATRRQTEDTTRAKQLHEMTTRELIRAINDENAALQRSIATGREAELQALATAQAKRQEALRRVESASATLRELRAEEERVAFLARGNPDTGAIGQGLHNERIAALETELSTLRAALTNAERGITAATVPLTRRAAEAAADPSRRIQEDYDRALERATGQLNWNVDRGMERGEADRRYRQALDAAIAERDRATRQLQESRQAERREATDARREARAAEHQAVRTREEIYREARARAQAAGFSITSGFRTPRENRDAGGAANSFHLSHQALDIGLGPGINRDTIRRAFQGFNITELLGPGDPDHADHWHVAWSGAMEGVGNSADELAEDLRRLLGDFTALTRQFDPAGSAAADYAAMLQRIGNVELEGLIDPDTASEWRLRAAAEYREVLARVAQERQDALTATLSPEFRRELEALRAPLTDTLRIAAQEGARAFRDGGIDAANEIAKAFGGRLGGVFGLVANGGNGDLNGFGGRFGGLLGAFGRSGHQPTRVNLPGIDLGGGVTMPGVVGTITNQETDNRFFEGLQEVFRPMREALSRLLDKLAGIFGDQGSFTKAIGKAAGFAIIGGGAARMTGGSQLGGSVGGALGGFAGDLLSKSLGSLGGLAGPLGSIAGGILGGMLGKALKGSKRGSATITGVDSDISTRGNSSGFRSQASGAAGNIQDALQQIAEQLGGQLGGFSVSIGVRDGKFRVDPSGRGVTKTKRGAVDFGEDEGAAISFAIMDAIMDGAITGLSEAVQRALKSSKDVDKAIREALKVQEIEDLLKESSGGFSKALRDFERQASERVRIATKYGFDVIKIEEINAKERLKIEQQLLDSRVGALKELLSDINVGDLFEGSLADRRDRLIAELDKARTDAEAGVDGAADRQAQLSRDLLAVSREAFGTAGGEFAADLDRARTGAERVIELENERLRVAQEMARETNTQLNEANDHLAEQTTLLRGIGGALDIIAGNTSLLGSSSGGAATARVSEIRSL